jgi:hypothetical protein
MLPPASVSFLQVQLILPPASVSVLQVQLILQPASVSFLQVELILPPASVSFLQLELILLSAFSGLRRIVRRLMNGKDLEESGRSPNVVLFLGGTE